MWSQRVTTLHSLWDNKKIFNQLSLKEFYHCLAGIYSKFPIAVYLKYFWLEEEATISKI